MNPQAQKGIDMMKESGMDEQAAMEMAKAAGEMGMAPPGPPEVNPDDPYDAHLGAKFGEDWKNTPQPVKDELKAAYSALDEIDLSPDVEAMIGKEMQDVKDAAAAGDKAKVEAEIEDLRQKLAAAEEINKTNEAVVLAAIVKDIKGAIKEQAPDLAGDEEVLGWIEEYLSNLKPEAPVFDHIGDAVVVAVGKARAAGKKPKEEKKEMKEEKTSLPPGLAPGPAPMASDVAKEGTPAKKGRSKLDEYYMSAGLPSR